MGTKISVGKERFLYFLNQIQNILEKAEASESTALTAYMEDMRTPLFMLEALSRLYKKIHNHHKFSKLDDLFKEMEDSLGRIDFYYAFHKEFTNQKRIPDAITGYLEKQTNKKVKEFNRQLKEKKWIGKHQKGIRKIIKKLEEIDWLNEKEDAAEILDVYCDAICKVNKKYENPNLEFNDIETDVHELRRELRWLSIYPQALRGLMQLKVDNDPPDFLKKYLTPAIINSPYNIMPDGNGLEEHILLNNNYFYALSWMIAELGKLKDSGLKIIVLEESFYSVYKTSVDTEPLAYSLCDENQMTLSEILTQSQNITQKFFGEKILENIISHE